MWDGSGEGPDSGRRLRQSIDGSWIERLIPRLDDGPGPALPLAQEVRAELVRVAIGRALAVAD